jgi:uncharacterized coiled-coil protein SlyX
MSHWIYHPDYAAKIVSDEEHPAYLQNGWFNSPAEFPEKDNSINVLAEKVDSNVAQALIDTLNQQLAEREKEIAELKAQLALRGNEKQEVSRETLEGEKVPEKPEKKASNKK